MQERSPSQRLLFVLWMVLALGSFGLICSPLFFRESLSSNDSDSPSRQATTLVELLGDNPIAIQFERISFDLPVERTELDRYVGWMTALGPDQNDASARRSRKLHTGRLVAISGGTPDWLIRGTPPAEDQVKLREDDFVFGWRGLEAAESPNGDRSEHRDQTLSALADLGVTLNATIETKDGNRRVADLLSASLNEFHLGQKEISWTVAAYAHYLPPQTAWWNRYGEEFSFNTVVQEMIGRKLDRESCQGTHFVMTLTKILKVDREFIVLTAEVRERLLAYICEKLSEAVDTQLEDGSWPMAWSSSGFFGIEGYTPKGNDINRVIVTGHLLEWFHLLPKDLKPPINVVRMGTLWVLQNLRASPQQLVNEHFCPYTHAVLSLYLARYPG